MQDPFKEIMNMPSQNFQIITLNDPDDEPEVFEAQTGVERYFMTFHDGWDGKVLSFYQWLWTTSELEQARNEWFLKRAYRYIRLYFRLRRKING